MQLGGDRDFVAPIADGLTELRESLLAESVWPLAVQLVEHGADERFVRLHLIGLDLVPDHYAFHSTPPVDIAVAGQSCTAVRRPGNQAPATAPTSASAAETPIAGANPSLKASADA